MKNTGAVRNAAMFALLGIVAYQVLLVVLVFLRPDLHPAWQTLSEWAIGPYGWLMSAGFILSGLCYGALLFAVVDDAKGFFGRVGVCMLGVCAVCAIGVGICTTDPMPLHPPLTTRGQLHVVFGMTQLALLPWAAVFLNLGLVLTGWRGQTVRPLAAWSAGLPLIGFGSLIAYMIVRVIPLGPNAYGPGLNVGWPSRFAFLLYGAWVATISAGVLRSIRSRRQA